MLRRRPPLLVHLLLALCAALSVADALAREVNDPAVITLATDVRSGPAVGDSVLATVPAGHRVRVLELRGASARVESGTVKGWVPSSKLRIGGGSRAASARASAGGGLFRGLTGLFGGGGGGTSAKVPVGVRGLTKQDIASAQPDPASLERAESMRASKRDAQAFARSAGVSSRSYSYVAASGSGAGGFFSDGGASPGGGDGSGGDN